MEGPGNFESDIGFSFIYKNYLRIKNHNIRSKNWYSVKRHLIQNKMLNAGNLFYF